MPTPNVNPAQVAAKKQAQVKLSAAHTLLNEAATLFTTARDSAAASFGRTTADRLTGEIRRNANFTEADAQTTVQATATALDRAGLLPRL